MKTFLTEAFKINKNTGKKNTNYSLKPTSKKELKQIIENRLNNEGKDCNLNDIDVSKITDMSFLFIDLDPGDIEISLWDVSNVTTMEGMFNNCRNFNADLSEWDISNVKNFNYTFYFCKKLTSNFEKWEINTRNHENMFFGCLKVKVKPTFKY